MKEKKIDILKKAILLEMRGRVFYQTAAREAKNSDVRAIFTMMATEEDYHSRQLSKQLSSYVETGAFLPIEKEEADAFSDSVFTSDLQAEIDAAGFEAAAISAAMALEKNSIAFYSEQAEQADDEDEKKIFHWLATWEKTHLAKLEEVDQLLQAKVWGDASFWEND